MFKKRAMVTTTVVLLICCFVCCVLVALAMGDDNGEEVIVRRKKRFVSFHTGEDGNIEVELEFGVPLLDIPVKKSLDYAKGSMANINLGALALSGVVLFVSIIVVPSLVNLFSVKFGPFLNEMHAKDNAAGHRMINGSLRNLEDATVLSSSKFWHYVENFERKSDVNVMDCLKLLSCTIMKNASKRIHDGNATSNDKIVDGIVTNEWFIYYVIDGTRFEEIVRNGRDVNLDCSVKYDGCHLTLRTLETFLRRVTNKINMVA